MLDDHLGICFLWGSFMNGQFVPGGIIFFYAVLLVSISVRAPVCACASVWQMAQRVDGMNISPGMKVPLVVVALLGVKGFAPKRKS